MIKLHPVGATPPNIPQSSIQSKPSFTSRDEDYEYDEFEASEQWKENQQDFEEFKRSDSSFLKKVGEFGGVVVSGVLVYGSSKWGFNKTYNIIKDFAHKKAVTDKAGKVVDFVKTTIIPNVETAANKVKNTDTGKVITKKANEAFTYVKNSKAGKVVTEKTDQAFTFVKNSKVGKAVSDKTSKIVKELKGGSCGFVLDKEAIGTKKETNYIYASSVEKAAEHTKNAIKAAKDNLPEKIKRTTIEALSIGSGIAGAVEGGSILHGKTENDEYQGAA